jgi:hypothetical protein
MKLTDDKIKLLIELLAATDCVFAIPRTYKPIRLLAKKQMTAILERRDGFALSGMNELGGGSASARKATERAINGLKSDGLVMVFSRAGRRVGCRLSERGDDLARWFAAMEMYYEAWPLLRRLEVLTSHGVCMGEMVSELDLALIDDKTPDYWEVHIEMQDRLAVLKMRGLVDEALNGYANCFFSLTAAGRKTLQKPAPQPPEDLPKYKSFCDEYEEHFKRNLAERENWQPIHKNEVYIPLSCGVGPDKSWHELDPKVLAELRAMT